MPDRTSTSSQGRPSLSGHRRQSARVFPALLESLTLAKANLDRLSAALFCLFILAAAAVSFAVPERNWDMIAYVALAIEDEHERADTLHAATWDIVRQNTSDKEFTALSDGEEYRRSQFASPADFVSQLPMYRMKIGYVALLKALSPHIGPLGAIQAVNVVSVLALGGLLLVGCRQAGSLQGAVLLIPVMLLSGFMLMARSGTPDILVAALTVAGTMLLCSRAPWWSVPVLVAAFLVRPDTIVVLFALVLSTALFRWRRLPAVAAFAIACALTAPLSNAAGSVGWWAHFWFANVEMQANMDNFQPPFSVLVYLKGLASGLAISLIKYNWLPLAGMLLFGAWLLRSRLLLVPIAVAVPMFAMVLAVGGKFVLFPMPYDRLYAVHLWIFALGLLAISQPRFAQDKASGARAIP